ncbi:hypothetical protein C8R43DRAFT_1125620 [Mycena crocata]|nr:hypothetical protein C8R43DRAFT_1125620 [Mycena crocata]
MAIFQAATLVCLYSTNEARATAYRNYMKQWLDGLHKLYPGTEDDRNRPNAHAAFHLYDFLRLFGPVAPLPSGKFDPFARFIDFPAKTYSSDMVKGTPDRVDPSRVKSHCARFEFSNKRAVLLDLATSDEPEPTLFETPPLIRTLLASSAPLKESAINDIHMNVFTPTINVSLRASGYVQNSALYRTRSTSFSVYRSRPTCLPSVSPRATTPIDFDFTNLMSNSAAQSTPTSVVVNAHGSPTNVVVNARGTSTNVFVNARGISTNVSVNARGTSTNVVVNVQNTSTNVVVSVHGTSTNANANSHGIPANATANAQSAATAHTANAQGVPAGAANTIANNGFYMDGETYKNGD